MADENPLNSRNTIKIDSVDFRQESPEDDTTTFDGYDTDRDDTVKLTCPDCGEYVELVNGEGLLCGCRETPGQFEIIESDY